MDIFVFGHFCQPTVNACQHSRNTKSPGYIITIYGYKYDYIFLKYVTGIQKSTDLSTLSTICQHIKIGKSHYNLF